MLGLVGFASRWTYYIGKDGTLLEIDKSIKPATSAEDIAATLEDSVWNLHNQIGAVQGSRGSRRGSRFGLGSSVRAQGGVLGSVQRRTPNRTLNREP